MAAAVFFGERCVRIGNFAELLRSSFRVRSTVLPWRHMTSQKISQTKRSAKGLLFYVDLDKSVCDERDTPTWDEHRNAKLLCNLREK